METLFRRIADSYETGLQLITLPTGTGKTYSMRQFVAQYVIDHMDDENCRNIVIVTSLKKNLINRDLEEEFERKGHPELYGRYCLFLDSVSNAVLEGWRPEIECRIEGLFPDIHEADEFLSCIRTICSFRESRIIQKQDLARLEGDFARTVEPAFRRMLREAVRKQCGNTISERLKTIENDERWSWIPEIYPSVRTSECRVFLMSADKFVTVNDTIVGKSATVYDSDITKGAIIFIDEFDSTKERIQKAIVGRNLRRNVDVIDLFNRIHDGLRAVDEQPARLYRPVGSMGVEDECSLKDLEGKVLERFEEVGDLYRLGINKKVIDAGPSKGRRFIFHGESIISVSHDKGHISLRYDRGENMDFIDIAPGDMTGWKVMQGMFRQMRSCIRYFSAMVSKLSVNYSKQIDDPAVSYEDCIRTVLGEFGLRGNEREFMVEEVLMSSDKMKAGMSDMSFYESGFRIYTFHDSRSDGLRSSIRMTSMDLTPEKILLRVCRRALVFGLSATAELDTVIGNYDLEYIKAELADSFLPSVAEDPDLRRQIDGAWSRYGDVKIEVDTIDARMDGVYRDDVWGGLFSNPSNLMMVKDHMGRLADHVAERYYRMCSAFSDFISRSESTAGLVFFSKMPKDGDDEFDKRVLGTLFGMIIEEEGIIGFDVGEQVVYISGDGFEGTKERMKSKLSERGRAFVITTYGTLGAGQNIQYLRSDDEYVNISSRDDGREADFDFLYVDKPTNIVENPVEGDMEGNMNLMFQLLCLKEKGEVTHAFTERSVSDILLGDRRELMGVRGLMLDTDSAKKAAAGKVIQAIGRICRTNMKRPVIRILADRELSAIFTDRPESYGRVNVETRRLIEEVVSTTPVDGKANPWTQRSLSRSHRAKRRIDQIRREWTEDSISEWRMLREYVLTNPTTDASTDVTYNMYVDAPGISRYWYTSGDGDFNKLSIFLSKPSVPCEEVSEISARLDELMSVPEFRKLFESKGYATGFINARFVLSPPLFKNIYKGAIGEVVGDFVLNEWGFRPAEMPKEYYEMFDAIISEGSYIDYKYWSSSGFTNEDEQVNHIFGKLRSVRGRVAIIANVLRRKEDNSEISTYREDGMTIITIPWLIEIAGNTASHNTEAIEVIGRAIR